MVPGLTLLLAGYSILIFFMDLTLIYRFFGFAQFICVNVLRHNDLVIKFDATFTSD